MPCSEAACSGPSYCGDEAWRPKLSAMVADATRGNGSSLGERGFMRELTMELKVAW